MTLQEFINKYNGKFVEAGGSAGAENQCVDLANQYIVEVLGLPKILWANAKDFPSRAGDKYDWIPNTLTAVPQSGDLMIWGFGAYGHIAIFVEGNVLSFKSFDQNYPLNSVSHIQKHNYKNVSGWMRPKGGLNMSQYTELRGKIEGVFGVVTKHMHRLDALTAENNNRAKESLESRRLIVKLTKDTTASLTKNTKAIESLSKDLQAFKSKKPTNTPTTTVMPVKQAISELLQSITKYLGK